MLFKQKKAYLYNGTEVKLGDKIRFINSDGEECIGEIERDINNSKNPKRLFFWNNNFEIKDYHGAEKI